MSPSTATLPIAVILIFLCSFACGASSLYGDAQVYVYKNDILKRQVNIYRDDQFIVNFKLRSSSVEEYNDIAFLNVTQYVTGIPTRATVILNRANKSQFNVTTVSPETSKYGRNATFVSRSVNPPVRYVTSLAVKNSGNDTLSLRNINYIELIPHGIVTNPGLRLVIIPKP